VNFATADGTATAPRDYVSLSGTLTFPPGTATQTINVVTNIDSVVDGAETFFVNLSGATNAPIAFSQGTGTIQDPQVPGDFNGDRKPDILWQNQANGQLGVWYMDGVTRTGFARLNPSQDPDLTWKIVGTADFNGDGKTDVLWQNQASGLLRAWYMDGVTRTGSAPLNPSQGPDLNWKIVGTADFNNDGKPDILWQNQANGQLMVWYMDGVTQTGTASLNPGQLTDPSWKIVGTGDFNGDGKPDILWQNHSTGLLMVWYMDGVTRTNIVLPNPSRVTDLNWKIDAAADFNGDGKPDILWHNQATGRLLAWFMDGVRRTGSAPLNPSQVTDPNWTIVGPK
jgi:hypothetical protein